MPRGSIRASHPAARVRFSAFPKKLVMKNYLGKIKFDVAEMY